MLKIAKSFFVILVVAVIAVSATSAAWTDSEVNSGNYFETGTLDLTIDPATAVFNATGIYPGWSETQSIEVANSGSVDFDYNVAASLSSGSDSTLYDDDTFLLVVTNDFGNTLYSGTVHDFAGFTAGDRSLTAGSSENLNFTISLDASAGNELQGLNSSVDFTFTADMP